MRRLVATVALLVVATGPVGAYPGDVFQNAQPASAPAAVAAPGGDDAYGVSDQGEATYRVPIAAPPGNNGMAPSLALSYSSRNPTRGGLAAGWSLAMPRIEVDTTRGRLARVQYRTGAGARLVRVDEPAAADAETFRAERDSGFARFERVRAADGTTLSWRVRTLDGRVQYYGESTLSRDIPHLGSAPGATEARWFLTREVDRFGNDIQYSYQKAWSLIHDESLLVPVDIYPTGIEWGGSNRHTRHARLDFDYATEDRCAGSWVPIGASFSWRTGFPLMEGARRLTTIRVMVRNGNSWTERRRYTLDYDRTELTCAAGKTHAPLRLLTSVQERATASDGTVTQLPAATFEYGRTELDLVARTGPEVRGSGTNAQAPQKAGGWPTLDAMLLDLDGDGRLDWLTSQPTADPRECGVTWQRNQANGQFAPPAPFTLPTNPWAGAARNDSNDPDHREGCSLSHQFSRVANDDQCGLPATYTSYRFMDVTGDGRPDLVTATDANQGRYHPEDDQQLWPRGTMACPGDAGACRDDDGEPMRCAVSSPVPPFQQVPVDDDDPNDVCPAGMCPYPGCDDLLCDCMPGYCGMSGQAQASVFAPPIDHSGGMSWLDDMYWNGPAFTTGDQGHEGRIPPHVNYACAQQPEEQCGRFVWRVYENTGAGFADEPRVLLSPVPLESDRATSAVGAGALASSSSWHGFIDMDGDAIPDAVFMAPFWSSDGIEQGAAPRRFQVFRGDGGGGFHGDLAGDPYLWAAPVLGVEGQAEQRARVTLSRSGRIPWFGSDDDQRSSKALVTLADLNGDGLPDYVDARDAHSGETHVRVFYNTGAGFEAERPGSSLEVPAWNGEMLSSAGENRQYVIEWREGWHNGQLDRGWSRDVVRVVDIDADGLLDVVMLPEPQPDVRNPWQLSGQDSPARVFVNVGDRLVPMGSTAKVRQWWPALARIRLSSGGHVFGAPRWTLATDFLDLDGDGLPEAFTNDLYASTCAPGVAGDFIAPCATGDRSLTSVRDGQGLRLLRTVHTGTGADIGFAYAPVTGGRVPHPLWVATRMTVSPGGGAPTMVTAFEQLGPQYLPDERSDWAFRGFDETTTIAPSGARTIKRFDHTLDWTGPLVETLVLDATGHLDRTSRTTWERRTLFAGAVATLHPIRTEERTCGAAQSPAQCAAAGALRVEATTWATLGGQAQVVTANEVDDRRVGYQPRLQSSATSYWTVPLREDRATRLADGTWTPSGATVHQWDPSWRVEVATSELSDAQTAATTERQFDLMTGNVIGVRRPVQAASGGAWATCAYDSNNLFVVQARNELGHRVVSTWDTATGAQLSARGPNGKNGVLEGWTRTIDGFGRTLTRSVYAEDGTGAWVPYVIERNTYADAPDAAIGGLRRTTGLRRVELTEDRWVTTTVDVDGVGRATVEKQWVAGTEVATTRRWFDAAGQVARVDAPTPAAATGTVTWTFGHDSLGRPTSIDGPDGSGERWSYDGRWSTHSDALGAAGGTAGVTRTRVDGFGQLVEVGELAGTGFATTRYTYDGNGAMSSIVDPDGVTTLMDHDWRGRRVRIRRGDRTWSYRYDADSNLVAAIAPRPADADVAPYTTTIVYDALDREVSRLAGGRALTPTQLAEQGAASVERAYDDPASYALGRLTKVTQPWGATLLAYDARGLPSERTIKVTLPGLVTDTRTEKLSYNALGVPRTQTYADGPNNASVVTFTTDDRGLPARTAWGTTVLGNYAYSAAGQLTRRAIGTTFEHVTERDLRGRVTRQRVKSKLGGVGFTPRAEVTYGYDGASEVRSMTWGIAAGATLTPEPFTYTYDARGQLATATGAAGYDASFAYTAAGRLDRARVQAPGAPSVVARDVRYDYGLDGDPETPDALYASDGWLWLGLDHDLAGNTTARTGSAPATSVHDGFDQIRSVATAAGREAYWYDGDRQRVGVAVYDPQGALVRVRWNIGATEVWYRPGGAVDKTIAHVAHAGPVARIENRTRHELVFTDHHGHTLAVLDSAGALLAGFVYGPFGETLRTVGSTTELAEVNRRFNGEELDTTGLYYYGYRYYDPLTLTWTQADPLYRVAPDLAYAQPRRALAYTFSLNNPLRYTDPNGLENDEEGQVCVPDPVEEEPTSTSVEEYRDFWDDYLRVDSDEVAPAAAAPDPEPTPQPKGDLGPVSAEGLGTVLYYDICRSSAYARTDDDGAEFGVRDQCGGPWLFRGEVEGGTMPSASFSTIGFTAVDKPGLLIDIHGPKISLSPLDLSALLVSGELTIKPGGEELAEFELGWGCAFPLGWDTGPIVRTPGPLVFGVNLKIFSASTTPSTERPWDRHH